jgi:hypothetical protein
MFLIKIYIFNKSKLTNLTKPMNDLSKYEELYIPLLFIKSKNFGSS